ncbi:MAG: hypothetical protein RIG62_31315 [Cyclobacteriaceae bacterium]
MKKNTLDGRFLGGRMMLENALRNGAVKKALAQYGYNETRLLEGKALLDAAEEWQHEQKDLYTSKGELTRQIANDEQDLLELFNNHLTIARFAFRNDPFWQNNLQLNAPRLRDRAGRLEQIRTFYRRLTPPANAAMKKFGAPTEDLERANVMAGTLLEVLINRQSKVAEAQQATKNRNDSLDAWKDWRQKFTRVAEVALANEPQLLEALGVEVRS